MTSSISEIKHEMLFKLKKMRLPGMISELDRQLEKNGADEEYIRKVEALINSEWNSRAEKRIQRMVKDSHLKIPHAVISEEMNRPERGLDYSFILDLARCEWISDGRNLVITGQAGTGKTYLSCALGIAAIQKGYRVRYYKASRLIEELVRAEKEDRLSERLSELDRYDLLIIDDFGMMNLDFSQCRNLFEVLDSREGSRSVICASQLPFADWYDLFENATYADACLDRLNRPSSRIQLKGDSMRAGAL